MRPLRRKPRKGSTFAEQAAVALATYTEPPDSDGHVMWTGVTERDGYGRVRVMGRLWLAHRLSYALHHGLDDLPASSVVHHTEGCGAAGCVAPDHLQLLDGHDASARNAAEMRGRAAYVAEIAALQRRVAELEAELAA